MTSISNAFENSILAQAGYIELPSNFKTKSDALKKNDIIGSLKDQGMTPAEAEKFASEYTVFATINDPITGLKATVFEVKRSSPFLTTNILDKGRVLVSQSFVCAHLLLKTEARKGSSPN
jgi:hypothetical protein